MKAFAVSAEAESLKPIKKHPAVLAAAGLFDTRSRGGAVWSGSVSLSHNYLFGTLTPNPADG